MIYDTINNASRYLGIQKNLDTALLFMMNQDLNELPYGITQIDEDKVFINIMDAKAIKEADGKYEYHKKYMDIQIDLQGVERINLSTSWDKELKAYKEDIGFVEAQKEISCLLGFGKFIVCNIGEPHMPGIETEAGSYLKKAVLKVSIED